MDFKNKELIALGEKNTDYPIEHWLIMYEEPVPNGGTYDRLISRHEGKISALIALGKYMEAHPDVVYKLELD